jgi:hypothetical protein
MTLKVVGFKPSGVLVLTQPTGASENWDTVENSKPERVSKNSCDTTRYDSRVGAEPKPEEASGPAETAVRVEPT